jgi:hypothetical protein
VNDVKQTGERQCTKKKNAAAEFCLGPSPHPYQDLRLLAETGGLFETGLDNWNEAVVSHHSAKLRVFLQGHYP